MRTPSLLGTAVLGIGLIGLLTFGASADQTKDETISVDRKGVILNGYDAVAYFTENKAVKGSKKYTAVHKNATYRFSSAQHRDMFQDEPEKYVPEYGGYCAYGAALGKKFSVNGKAFKVVDGKLYVNLDKGIAKKWSKDVPGFIEKADDNWPRIKTIPAKEL